MYIVEEKYMLRGGLGSYRYITNQEENHDIKKKEIYIKKKWENIEKISGRQRDVLVNILYIYYL